MEYIQVSAPVSHGSSGSPLFSDRGQVIGIIQSKVIEGDLLNFAIRSNEVAMAFGLLVQDELDDLAIERERSRVLSHFAQATPHMQLELRRIEASSCRILAKPDYQSKLVGLLLEGDVVSMVGPTTKQNRKSNTYTYQGKQETFESYEEWGEVLLPNGKVGYAEVSLFPKLSRKLQF